MTMSTRTFSSRLMRSTHGPSTGVRPSTVMPRVVKKLTAAGRSSTTTLTWSNLLIVMPPGHSRGDALRSRPTVLGVRRGGGALPSGLQLQEKEMIEAALAKTRGKVAGPKGGAIHQRLENLLDGVNRPVPVTLSRTHSEQAIEERVLRRRSLEAGHRSEVVVRVVAHAGECHVDQRAVVGLEREPEIELERAVGVRGHP